MKMPLEDIPIGKRLTAHNATDEFVLLERTYIRTDIDGHRIYQIRFQYCGKTNTQTATTARYWNVAEAWQWNAYLIEEMYL